MKTIKIVSVAAMLLFMGNLSAREPKKERVVTKTLSDQIAHILRGTAIPVQDKEREAKIVFILNEEKEIVVLAVHSKYPEMATLIKRQLNHKRISITNHVAGKNYIVPIRVVP